MCLGIQWKAHDPYLFFSSSKDSTLYQHLFKDALRPADTANPVGLDIGLGGNMAHATSDKYQTGGQGNSSSGNKGQICK